MEDHDLQERAALLQVDDHTWHGQRPLVAREVKCADVEVVVHAPLNVHGIEWAVAREAQAACFGLAHEPCADLRVGARQHHAGSERHISAAKQQLVGQVVLHEHRHWELRRAAAVDRQSSADARTRQAERSAGLRSCSSYEP